MFYNMAPVSSTWTDSKWVNTEYIIDGIYLGLFGMSLSADGHLNVVLAPKLVKKYVNGHRGRTQNRLQKPHAVYITFFLSSLIGSAKHTNVYWKLVNA